MTLKRYHQKRDFKHTPEPKGKISHDHPYLFVIQKHAASHLHYDFRLELDGVLKSWAVPKGPCLDATIKRLAMHVEDHPVEYGFFEGIIPKGKYGGGTVMLWDQGTWVPLDDNPQEAYKSGHIRLELKAKKLKGRWDLIRFKDDKHWFLIKFNDKYAKPLEDYDITLKRPNSVVSKQTLEEITNHYQNVWTDNGSFDLPKNVKTTKFPDFIKPQLATLVDKAPEGEKWIHEIKFDGYRILAFVHNGQVTLKSRNNKDWTTYFPNVVAAIKKLNIDTFIVDGEIVLLNDEYKSDFQLLQNSITARPDSSFIYYIFDLLYYNQYELMSLPLIQRKELLKQILPKNNSTLSLSDSIKESGKDVLEQACEMGLEGIISKKIDDKYYTKRSMSWLKVKCIKRQEFIICGYTKPQGSRSGFGALLLGVYTENKILKYAGRVGTGFNEASLKIIYQQLQQYKLDQSPFTAKVPDSKQVTWVKPVLIAEVAFSEWTDKGHLRHPSFKGLRQDKTVKQIEKEIIKPVEKVMDSKLITHADKILYSEDNITKGDILDYYEKVSDLILPYVKNRPLTLVRCPKDFNHCFYQRHYNATTAKELKGVLIDGKEGEIEYIYLTNKKGLLSLVQMGVLEIHPWGSKVNQIENPDWITFDLDPAPEIAWKVVVEAALEVKEYLDEYKLTSFVKTTGGKGLHVVVPIKPEYNWDEIKNFSHVFVSLLEKLKPDEYISKMTKSKRKGKIFIDYLRNQRSATAVSIYSTRARPHAPISVPLDWDELSSDKRDNEFTIRTINKRLEAISHDPWEKFLKTKQSLRLDKLE